MILCIAGYFTLLIAPIPRRANPPSASSRGGEFLKQGDGGLSTKKFQMAYIFSVIKRQKLRFKSRNLDLSRKNQI